MEAKKDLFKEEVLEYIATVAGWPTSSAERESSKVDEICKTPSVQATTMVRKRLCFAIVTRMSVKKAWELIETKKDIICILTQGGYPLVW